jgi:predicted RecA/RadA family phage recombinase
MSTNDGFNKGDQLALDVPTDTASGAAVLVGDFVGVTLCAEGEGGNIDGQASVQMSGVFDLPISTTTTIAKYGKVYITSGNVLTPVSSGNTLFGRVLTAKSATANEVVPVKLAKV